MCVKHAYNLSSTSSQVCKSALATKPDIVTELHVHKINTLEILYII